MLLQLSKESGDEYIDDKLKLYIFTRSGRAKQSASVVWRDGVPHRGFITLNFATVPASLRKTAEKAALERGESLASIRGGRGVEGGAYLTVRCKLARTT